MGISEEESIRRLTDEKSSIGHSAKWVAVAFFIVESVDCATGNVRIMINL